MTNQDRDSLRREVAEAFITTGAQDPAAWYSLLPEERDEVCRIADAAIAIMARRMAEVLVVMTRPLGACAWVEGVDNARDVILAYAEPRA
jgi:hypothetical protein